MTKERAWWIIGKCIFVFELTTRANKKMDAV